MLEGDTIRVTEPFDTTTGLIVAKSRRRHLLVPTWIDGAIETLSDRKNTSYSDYINIVLIEHLKELGIQTDGFGNITEWGNMGEPSTAEKILMAQNKANKNEVKQKAADGKLKNKDI